ncbi:MAG: VOC family protein [Chloroflexi bacterium]|nr:VOC family protein [Chloroflexota bacterium]
MLKRFLYHGLTVSDLDRSVAFYRALPDVKLEKSYEVSGDALEEATGYPRAHVKTALLSHGSHFLKLTQYLSPQGKKEFRCRINDLGASHVTMLQDNLTETYEALRAGGVKFMSPPVHPFPVTRPEAVFTYMLDPDGCIVQLSPRSVGIHHHAHAITNEEGVIAFYRDVLGMKTGRIRDITGPGISEGTGLPDCFDRETDMVLDGGPPESIEFQYFVHPQGKNVNETRLCDAGCSSVAFEVDDIQRSYEELAAKGVRFLSRPVNLTAEGADLWMVYLLDPEGYVLELRSGGEPV